MNEIELLPQRWGKRLPTVRALFSLGEQGVNCLGDLANKLVSRQVKLLLSFVDMVEE